MSDTISISSSVLPGTTRVVAFRGSEAISRLYRFDVFVTTPSDDIDFELSEAVGAKALLTIADAPDRPPFFFAGIVGDIELVQELADRALLRVVIVPRLSELALSVHSRLFTNQSALDVIKAVLEEHGVTDYESRVNASGVEEHICQYHESDLDFISRWMEREGIRYYFEHGEEGEKLILADDATYPTEPLGTPVRYYPQEGEHWSAAPSFRSFSSRHTNVPAAVKLRDNNYAHPSLQVSGKASISPSGAGEVNRHGERFFTPSEGQRLAEIRAQERIVLASTFHAVGVRRHLHAGYAFELEDHPRPSFNARYLVTEAHHHGNQSAASLEHWKKLLQIEHDDIYLVDLSAIPATTRFRPASVTAWPRIYGIEGALVDGPATSDYAQIDSQGRYNVKFYFDESSLKAGKASTWVRMMQPHGGGIEGFHFPLRKGTEVVVSFLGGDPDRPVVSGVVPTVLTPSPVTAGNHTKNVIQTGGRNRLELEDLAGQQRVTLSTPIQNTYLRMGAPNDNHNAILKTDGSLLIQSGTDMDVVSGGHKHETVTGEVTHIYKATMTETVTSDVMEKYQSKHTTNVTGAFIHNVTNTVTETYSDAYHTTVKAGGRLEEVTGLLHQIAHTSWQVDITGNATHTASGDYTVHHGGSGFWTYKGDNFTKVFGNYGSFTLGAYETIVAGASTTVVAGPTIAVYLGNYTQVVVGPTVDIRVGPKYYFASSPEINLRTMKTDFSLEKEQYEAIKDTLHGVRKSLAGLDEATGGLKNRVSGVFNFRAGLKQAEHGLETTSSGLSNMDAALRILDG